MKKKRQDFPEAFWLWRNEKHWSNEIETICLSDDVLRDLVPFAQFKKREKHPWSATFSKLGGFSLNVTLIHGCFWSFLNCTNGTKSRKASPRRGNLVTWQKRSFNMGRFQSTINYKSRKHLCDYGIETVAVPKKMTQLLKTPASHHKWQFNKFEQKTFQRIFLLLSDPTSDVNTKLSHDGVPNI